MISFFVSIIIALMIVIGISGLEFAADYLITKNNNITYTFFLGIFLYLVIGIVWGLLIFNRNKFQYNFKRYKCIMAGFVDFIDIYFIKIYFKREKQIM